MELKQVIVVRKDLGMSKGKLAAQVAHASVTASDRSEWKDKWVGESQKKSVLKCDNLDELLDLYEKAKRDKLPTSLIRDAGRTELADGTITCIGIGPAPADWIDKVTGHLKLL